MERFSLKNLYEVEGKPSITLKYQTRSLLWKTYEYGVDSSTAWENIRDNTKTSDRVSLVITNSSSVTHGLAKETSLTAVVIKSEPNE